MSIRSLALFNGGLLRGGGRLAGYRHRHHAGPHGLLRHDEEWGLSLATTGDRYLATSGDFFMATDTRQFLSSAWAAGPQTVVSDPLLWSTGKAGQNR